MKTYPRSALLALLSASIWTALPAQANQETFQINSYAVSGNRLLTQAEIASRVAPYVGPGKNFADIQKALETIERMYIEQGYAGIQVLLPEQELTQGVVRMEIRESTISQITVKGNQSFDEPNILAALPSLHIGETPNARRMSENVQLANENPARKLDVVLGVGKEPGTLNARVEVKDEKPWRAFITADNTGNTSTGHDRVGVALQHANLFNRDHVATLAYTTSLQHPDRTSIYSFSYRLPIYAWGDSIDFIAGYSDVDAGTSTTVAGPLAFSGKGSVLGLRYNHILPRKGHFSQRFIVGIDQRAYDNSCTIAGLSCGAGSADLTLRPASLAYVGQWEEPGNTTRISVTAVANIPGGSNGEQADFSLARPQADKDYRILRAHVSHAQSLPADWQLRVALNAQVSSDALVSAEQFGLVGSNAVRGFGERTLAADNGLIANLEAYTPVLGAGVLPGKLRMLAFYDLASGTFNKRQNGDALQRTSVASVGLGLRYEMNQYFSLRFDLAHVLDADRRDNDTRAGDWRGHLALSLGF